nr:hypothetical protein [Tanacetum cinerariifolium]
MTWSQVQTKVVLEEEVKVEPVDHQHAKVAPEPCVEEEAKETKEPEVETETEPTEAEKAEPEAAPAPEAEPEEKADEKKEEGDAEFPYLGICCYLAKIIAVNLDTSSDNSSSDFDNNTSDSASTSQIITSEEIDYDSPEYKGPPKSLLKWSKAKLQTSGSKAKLQTSPKILIVKNPVPITNCVLGDANAKTWDAILSKTFGVKIPPTMSCAYEKKKEMKISKIIVLSSDSSHDRKGPSKASVPKFEGPSVQGLLDWYGYNTIEEYLSWNYFPSTDKDATDKDVTDKYVTDNNSTDKDCIHESNSAMSKGKYVPILQKHNPKVKSHVPVTGCVLGLANVHTWDDILKKFRVRKPESCADKAKEKRQASICRLKASICRLQANGTWMAFGGNTRDLDSFREEIDKTTTLTASGFSK